MDQKQRIESRLEKLDLPISRHLAAICAQVCTHSSLILQAEPGAGKTTLVPLALLPLLEPDKRILVLEPRRLAARTAAVRMAEILGETVGETVGYRIRHEVKIGKSTRVEVITEGILTRMLQTDPELPDVGIIIFDEFHERSVDADLGLAFALEVQSGLRDNLKLLVMSATLQADNLKRLMPDAPVIQCEGKCFPVEVEYISPGNSFDWRSVLVDGVAKALIKSSKDILVFLPGQSEIEQAKNIIENAEFFHEGLVIHTLFGNLPFEKQQRALLPERKRRKIILSTNIAETSLTIEGVDCVIDCGLFRQNVFDPNSGFNRLETTRVSLASATQRQGRAGRLSAGLCIRLWTKSDTLRAQGVPEILRVDLAGFMLEAALWGVTDVSELALLDLPNRGMMSQAQSLLQSINALDSSNRVTAYGKQISQLGVHPRLAHLLFQSIQLGAAEIGCLLASMLEEKDIFIGEQSKQIDILARIEFLLHSNNQNRRSSNILRQKSVLYNRIKPYLRDSKVNQKSAPESLSDASQLLALAFPDRVAKRRGSGYLLASGRGAQIEPCYDTGAEYIVACQLGGRDRKAKIFLAIDIDVSTIESTFASQITDSKKVCWDKARQSVIAENQRLFGKLVLTSTPCSEVTDGEVASGLIDGIQLLGVDSLPWSDKLRQWQHRILKLRSLSDFAELFPDVSDEALLISAESWLMPFLSGLSKISQVTEKIFGDALMSILDWDSQQILNKLMPEKIQVASGSWVKLDYVSAQQPVLAVKLQEMFGEKDSPEIANGQIKVIVHLLSPARRPLQVTSDLASFWTNGYEAVKKEMKGRYPKHPWPDDPLTAVATNLTKRRLNQS
ncbi:ATP-dependent helicase HrpB [Aliikangiella sp. G2MR2-5]|uniref:ATP-dependent helicase HrpB n=1 Tax=Aliikangiella sp. G2MR2-5 TaxID=2788943 RepID=UPI0018A9E4B3|nr:ATP-dependent helicase HrpB [Aliikangiella sp. G2MR2-5]